MKDGAPVAGGIGWTMLAERYYQCLDELKVIKEDRNDQYIVELKMPTI